MVTITNIRHHETSHILCRYDNTKICYVTDVFLQDVESEKNISPEQAIHIILTHKENNNENEPITITTKDFQFLI